MNRVRAFSLIELIVGIAIIGLLFLLIIGVSAHVRMRAKDQQSTANLRQIGIGLFTFIADNNGIMMPRAYTAGGNPPGQHRYWTATLFNYRYVEDEQVFYDPRFRPYGPPESHETSKRIRNGTPETYGMRDWVKPGEAILTSTTRVAKPVSVIDQPSDFFIVADSYWTAWDAPGYGISPGLASANLVRLSGGMATALFMDGRVEKKKAVYFETLADTQGAYSAGQSFRTWSE